MKRIALFLLTLTSAVFAASDELEKNFTNPPAEARPWVYWFPLSGNLNKEGITADLESMARVGIGGALYMEVDQGAPKGKADFAGPLWREMFQHACKEAARLGLEINMNNDAGWCGSGGPWITPELSMQKVVWSATLVESGTNIDLMLPKPKAVMEYGRDVARLPQPQAVMDYYRDIAVLAMPAPEGDGMKLSDYGAKITHSGIEVKPGIIKLTGAKDQHPESITVEFPEPFTARWITASVNGGKFTGVLQTSDDGKAFTKVPRVAIEKSLVEQPFAPVKARFFRFEASIRAGTSVEISDFNLGSSYRIDEFYAKNGSVSKKMASLPSRFAVLSASNVIPGDQIRDVSAQMDASGKLRWHPPTLGASAGKPTRWLVLRFGRISTGKTNHPSPLTGCGLECDKFSKQAAKVMFNGLMGKLIEENKPLVGQGKTLVATHIDSWEVGAQNWTPLMRDEFKKRRGYDLLKYLPVFTGRVVDSLEVSERFLWDLRQSFSDMLVENYAGEFRRLANEHGLRLSIEAYGGCNSEELAYGGQADEPMGEFWSWAKFKAADSCAKMASSAHIYGRNILGAEAFTAMPDEKWLGHPGSIKDLGDWAFCEGINRFVFHRYAAQPWANVAPGMGMGPFGLHYERTQTWWEQSKPWHDYLTRCQYLLRQGLFVADVLYLQPEDGEIGFVPPYALWAAPNIRGGYNFDCCNIDVLLNRLSVKDGKFVLPDGMSYRVLVVPPTQTMTVRVLRKIKALADQGAIIIAAANAPEKSPSLADMGEGDEGVKKLTAELWPKLITGKRAAQLLGERGIKPDFSAKPLLRYIHRATSDTDFYFVANPEPTAVDAVAEFRVTGKQPELWWPDTGRTELAKDFEVKDGVTSVPLRLDPSGSVFVIFKEPTKATKGSGKNWVETTPIQEITGPWQVSFDPKWGPFDSAQGRRPGEFVFDKLEDWSKRPEPGIKYYSGHATYRKVFSCQSSLVSRRTYLDLGKVAVMAEVTLNGKPLGIVWKPPFRVEVTDAIKEGENTLEVKVVNLWANRLIGDEQLPEDSVRDPSNNILKTWPQWLLEGKPSPTGRFTFCTTKLWKKDDPLVESGLLGPVKLEIVKELK